VGERTNNSKASAAQSFVGTFRVQQLIDAGVLAVGDGYRAKNIELASHGIPFARAGNIDGGFLFNDADHFPEADLHKVGDKISLPGDVVFTSKGTVGRFAYVLPETPRFVFAPQLCYWRSLDPNVIDSRFLLYWMHGEEFWEQADAVKGQTDMADYVSLTDQRRMWITLPPLPEQRAIARVLGGLDDKIELNRRMNRTLEDLARGLFRSWFVDFDPMTKNGSAKAPAAPHGLFPKRLVDSPLGPIPEGWRVCSLREAFEVNPTRRIPAGEVAPYLDMQNMPTDSAIPDEWIMRACGSGMKFQNGDTLMARITPCLENGKTAYVNFLADGQVGWGSTEYIVLRSRPPLPPEQSYFLARDEDFRSFAIANMTGSSGRQRVPAAAFDKYLVVVPDAKAATAFGAFARGVLERVRMNSEESRRLAATRDALLPHLLSGEVRLHSDAAAVEEALA